jgi:ketosteroid isomerase-like protein
MKSALEVVQAAYAAFGRGDVPAILEMLADKFEWKFIGPKGLPYTTSCRSKAEVGKWFASIPETDEILAFEPREFIAGGNNVTVLGWERTKAKPGGKVFEAEWAHVFTIADGKVTRFWGIMDTEANAAARR